jgi:hypothetical protein
MTEDQQDAYDALRRLGMSDAAARTAVASTTGPTDAMEAAALAAMHATDTDRATKRAEEADAFARDVADALDWNRDQTALPDLTPGGTTP